jgi:uncharacterized membrane protein YcgQ (UPF0703/DUF1980 family)
MQFRLPLVALVMMLITLLALVIQVIMAMDSRAVCAQLEHTPLVLEQLQHCCVLLVRVERILLHLEQLIQVFAACVGVEAILVHWG